MSESTYKGDTEKFVTRSVIRDLRELRKVSAKCAQVVASDPEAVQAALGIVELASLHEERMAERLRALKSLPAEELEGLLPATRYCACCRADLRAPDGGKFCINCP